MKKKNFIIILLIISVLFLSVGYASLNSIVMDVDGDLVVKRQDGVFISDVVYSSGINCDPAYSSINGYAGTLINGNVQLQDVADSSIIYEVTVYNSTNDIYKFDGLKYEYDPELYDNAGIVADFSGINIGDRIGSKELKKFYISFHYLNNQIQDNNSLKYYINALFVKLQNYTITYSDIESTTLPTSILEGETLTIDFNGIISADSTLEIMMNDVKLEANVGYTFENNVLTINNVSGDVKIVKIESSNDNVVTDGDASLELGENETGLRVVKVMEAEHDWDGTANRYKLTIYNDTEKTITNFRGIIKYKDATFSYGDYITSFDNETGTANISCGWMTIPAGGSLSFEFVIRTTQDGYYPDIVVVGS